MISIEKLPLIDPIFKQKMEIEKVRKVAIKLSPILFNCIQLYEHSNISWEFAMQEAAILLAQQLSDTQDKLIKYVQKYGSEFMNNGENLITNLKEKANMNDT